MSPEQEGNVFSCNNCIYFTLGTRYYSFVSSIVQLVWESFVWSLITHIHKKRRVPERNKYMYQRMKTPFCIIDSQSFKANTVCTCVCKMLGNKLVMKFKLSKLNLNDYVNLNDYIIYIFFTQTDILIFVTAVVFFTVSVGCRNIPVISNLTLY